MNILTDNQLSQIKETISVEMLKRGYTAKMIEFKEVSSNSNRSRIEFQTEEFQTVPVMFKKINLSNFSSSISLNPELTLQHEREIFNVWLQVNIRYESFGGGSNGVGLFDYNCTFEKGDKRVFNEIIK